MDKLQRKPKSPMLRWQSPGSIFPSRIVAMILCALKDRPKHDARHRLKLVTHPGCIEDRFWLSSKAERQSRMQNGRVNLFGYFGYFVPALPLIGIRLHTCSHSIVWIADY